MDRQAEGSRFMGAALRALRKEDEMRTFFMPSMCLTNRFYLFLLATAWIWVGGSGVAWAMGDHGSRCATATVLQIGERIDGHHDSADDRDVFKVEVSEPGMLALTVQGFAAREPRIELLGKDCQGPRLRDLRFMERSDAGQIAEIRSPGAYFFRVASRPGLEGEAYRVESRFRPLAEVESEELDWSLDLPAECGEGGPEITVPSKSDVIVKQNIDEVDDDVLELRILEPVRIRIEADGAAVTGSLYATAHCDSWSQMVSGVLLNQPGGLLVFLEPGTVFLRLTAYLESTGGYGLRNRTLPPLGK